MLKNAARLARRPKKVLSFPGDPFYISQTPQILIDAGACPVKDETCKVAWRYNVPVIVVSNSPILIGRP